MRKPKGRILSPLGCRDELAALRQDQCVLSDSLNPTPPEPARPLLPRSPLPRISLHMEILWIGFILLGMMQTQAQGPGRHGGLPQVPGPLLPFHKICLLPSLGKDRVTGNPGRAGPVRMGRSEERGAEPNANPTQTSHSPVALGTLQVGTALFVHVGNPRL